MTLVETDDFIPAQFLLFMGYLVKDALGRSPYWYAVYQTGNGIERRKSTKCTDKRAARVFLQGLEAAELLGVTQGVTEEQFRSLIRETISRITGRKINDPTVRQHIASWLKSEENTIEASSVKRYRQVLGHFESFLGARANARLEALSKELFLEYRDSLASAGHSPRNINQIFKILARPFRVAADERLIQHNPIGAIKRLPSVSAEKGIFTGQQIKKLLAAAPDDEWRALIALGYYTGGRLMDLARLTWAAIDREKRTITFQQKKTGGVVLIPIHPELAHYLGKLRQGISRTPLLPKLSAKSGTGKSGLSNSFRKIMDDAGIRPGVARERVGAAGRNVSKLSFHSLRHSFTSELARAGVAPEIRQQLTGHSDLYSHKTYTHLELDTLTKAVSALPALS